MIGSVILFAKADSDDKSGVLLGPEDSVWLAETLLAIRRASETWDTRKVEGGLLALSSDSAHWADKAREYIEEEGA